MVKEIHSIFEPLLARISENMMKPNDDIFDSIVSEADFLRFFWIWRIEDNEFDVSKVTTAVRWI